MNFLQFLTESINTTFDLFDLSTLFLILFVDEVGKKLDKNSKENDSRLIIWYEMKTASKENIWKGSTIGFVIKHPWDQ